MVGANAVMAGATGGPGGQPFARFTWPGQPTRGRTGSVLLGPASRVRHRPMATGPFSTRHLLTGPSEPAYTETVWMMRLSPGLATASGVLVAVIRRWLMAAFRFFAGRADVRDENPFRLQGVACKAVTSHVW